MSGTQYLFLMAAVYFAPHMGFWGGLLVGLFFTVVGCIEWRNKTRRHP